MRVRRSQVHLVAGARPNFMKIAPLYRDLAQAPWCEPVLVHTGQHYDPGLSDDLWRELGLPEPLARFNVGSGSHAEQTARALVAYEAFCLEHPPDWAVVVGDVNSTLACALAAKKMGLPVAHLEAGLRSGDLSMPEEINRLLTDALADLLWTPSPDADDNLRREGHAAERIVRVGNIMLDAFEMLRPRIEAAAAPRALGLEGGRYAVATLHRPSNVDDAAMLGMAVAALRAVARRLPVVLPLHPRTRRKLEEYQLIDEVRSAPGVRCLPPLGYVDFMSLVRSATVVITDSGGVQEETTYLGVPCLTMRTSTERPITVTHGTNRLVDLLALEHAVDEVLSEDVASPGPLELWDGQTAGRVAASLASVLGHAGQGDGP